MSNLCNCLHEFARSLPRRDYTFAKSQLPKNGIYFVFEKGEVGHGGDRIVRVGTHTGDNNLPKRLKEHFITENKDRSIFRKNIGRAILNKVNDPFLQYWNEDLTSRASKLKFGDSEYNARRVEVEKQVTQYMQKNLSFSVFPVETKVERLELEAKIISTVSMCKLCGPSPKWLGNNSPELKIKNSGLWLSQHLNGQILSIDNCMRIKGSID
ncbi:MAG: hypothetical protein QXU18_16360 [Thermoplasmatales archaeon]